MKKTFISFITFILLVGSAFADTTIRMEKEGGVYKIPCKINGAKLKMIFDSGASSVCLSESMAEYLLENDYISINDFIGVGSSSIADGRIVDHLRINLRDVEIEGLHLRNIEGIVIVGQKGSLLLGQSAIQALGPVTINGDLLIVHNGTNHFSDSEITSLQQEAMNHIKSSDWYRAIALYEKLDKYGVADYVDLYLFVFALQQTGQYEKSGEVLARWFKSYVQNASSNIIYYMYDYYSSYYRFKERPDQNMAIGYLFKMQNMLPKIYSKNTTDYYYQDYFICKDLGDCYFSLKQYLTSRRYYEQAINSYTNAKHYSFEQTIQENFRDERLGYLLYMTGLCEEDTYMRKGYIKDAARMGDKDAQAFCHTIGWSYY